MPIHDVGCCEQDNALNAKDVIIEQSMGSLKGKVALITGADSTVGELTANELVKGGAQVVLTVSRPSELPRLLEPLGGAALGICVDVSNVDALSRLFERIDREVGKIDILFPNADLGEYRSSILDVGDDHSFGIKSLTFTIQKALPRLRDGASIILITSAVVAGSMIGNSAIYVAAACARGFARDLVTGLKHRHIRVNGVSLGTVDVAKLEHLPAAFGNEQRPFPQEVTLGRESTIEQVANTVVSLATDSDITGHELIMNGGKSYLSPLATEFLLDSLGSPEKVAGNAAFLASGISTSVNGMELLVDGHMIVL